MEFTIVKMINGKRDFQIYLLSLVFVITFSLPMMGYGQGTDGMANETVSEHAAHTIDNLVMSQYIPLEGQLAEGDYLFLVDLTPFTTSVEGHSHIAAKIPCDDNGNPKLTIVTGIAPKLDSLNITDPIINGTIDGEDFNLSSIGKSCLYHSELPKGLKDIALFNTFNETINFSENGGYSIALTVHGTAIQHDSMPIR